VKAGGEIAGGCEGKNAWDAAVRTNVPHILDISVLSWKKQSLKAIAELRDQLDCEFEYVGYHLTAQGFRNAVKRFMKSECSRLKEAVPRRLHRMPCPHRGGPVGQVEGVLEH
jgi:hypothetical protein